MINKIKTLISFAFVLFSASAFSQTTDAPMEMADGMRQSGKIYVVVAVLCIIFTGIVTYLIILDRKINKLEKEIKNK